MKKFLSPILLIGASVMITLSILNLFSIGFTIIGLWDIAKYYLPLVLVLSIINKIYGEQVYKKYFNLSLLLNLIFILFLVIEIKNFSF